MNANRAAALLRLFGETTALFHRLRAIAAEVHGQSDLSAGQRGVLLSLDRLGPQTVPQLARARPVSRQHVQVLVNGMLKNGLVVAEENPAHRRSALVHLTPKGMRQLEAMQKRERDLLVHARFGLTAPEIEAAAETLDSVRRFLESKEWRKHVAGNDREADPDMPEHRRLAKPVRPSARLARLARRPTDGD
jgi:DNA-binding MarR family transcriptional regulator